jgi:prepilin-type N-terminal cleavage/methylation domain-containing protein
MKMKTKSTASQGFTLVEIMIVIVIMCLLASMALPAVNKLRQTAQDQKVLNNAKQLAVAADLYYLEHGVSTVTLDKIVGPTASMKTLEIIANETYPKVFNQGSPIIVTGIAGSRTITYTP